MVNESERSIYQNALMLDDLVSVSRRSRVTDPENGFYNFNMSIVKDDFGMLTAFRSSDFMPPAVVEGKVSFISTARLQNNDLKNIERLHLKGYGINLWGKYNAMEDPRLIKWRGDVWCLFVRPNHYLTKISVEIVNLRTGEHRHFEDPIGRDITKNWMPYVDDAQDLFLITDVDPLRVFRVKDESLIPVVNNESKAHSFLIHGGSNLIDFDGRMVGVVHGRFKIDEVWFYWHSLASWGNNFDGPVLGRPFNFELKGVEFCLSIMKDNNSVVIPYSTMDQTISIVEIDDEEFRKLL